VKAAQSAIPEFRADANRAFESTQSFNHKEKLSMMELHMPAGGLGSGSAQRLLTTRIAAGMSPLSLRW
jgi:hypothetical protein